MQPVQLIHWNEAEAEECVRRLRAAGYEVEFEVPRPELLKAWKRRPPLAFVIDLSRLPSHGRDLAMAVRGAKTTRHVPLVFVAGQDTKVQQIRQQLPDATFTSWRGIRGALQRALAKPPAKPVVPESGLAGYSQTPLVKKLGIKPGSTLLLARAPVDFERLLGELPSGVKLLRQARGRRDLTIWFVRSMAELEKGIDRFANQVGRGGLWIAWPKQASAVETDVTQNQVRQLGLAAGLVDYKICAIDDTWSGLKFATRKQK